MTWDGQIEVAVMFITHYRVMLSSSVAVLAKYYVVESCNSSVPRATLTGSVTYPFLTTSAISTMTEV